MRIARVVLLAAAMTLPALARAQTNPCAERACKVIFDWGNGGGTTPDVDRRFGAPSTLESVFGETLSGAGWKVKGGADAVVTLTVRVTPQTRALCEAMPGVNPDYSCHTVSRAAVLFNSSDAALKMPGRVDIVPRCSDPKAFPSFAQFGRYAAEVVLFAVVNDGKGQRPTVKCL